MPGKKEEILALSGADSGTGRDGKFQFMPESLNYGYKNLLTYDEFYYKDYRTQKLLVDTETGETQEWTKDDPDRLKEFLREYPTISLVESEVPTVKLAIVIQGKVMYDGPNPLGIDNYPFVPVLWYYNPQISEFSYRIQGIIRGLRDAQYLYNRRRVIELDILESQINSGWIYKENALVNPKDVFMYGQGRGLALKEEAQMTDVQQIVAPQIPPSMIQLSELLAREVMEISGVNEELLGSSNEDVAGVLSALRQGAGLTTLQVLFDQLDRSQKLLGKIMVDIIQANFTPGKIKRIIEEEPADQFYNKSFGRYDAAVEEGLNTTTQRQMQFAQLLQLREAGVPISTQDLLDASTMQGKKKIIENAQAQEQQNAQVEQMKAQYEMQQLQAQTELLQARAKADTGLGLERISRIQENQALATERESAAHKDEEAALLNLVRAIKEMEGLDLMHLEKLVALSQMVKENSIQKKGEDTLQQAAIQQGAKMEMPGVQQEMQQQQTNIAQNLSGL